MDDLTKFLSFLYEQKEGFVYVATKSKQTTSEPVWNQEFFTWPSSQKEIEDYISLNSLDKDVYLAPALFKDKQSLKSRVKGSNVVWVEFDGQEQIDFESLDIPQPDCIVQTSSPTHLHCYWKVPYIESTDVLEDINYRLTFHLEADSSGWDAPQVLRPPTSKNWKYDGVPVEIVHFTEQTSFKHSLTAFDAAPPITKSEATHIQVDKLENPFEVLKHLQVHPKLYKRITEETVNSKSEARSSFIMKIAYELAEEGANHIQIVSLLVHVDDRVGKFAGRRDRLTRLSQMASLALLNIQREEALTLYSPSDILNHTETLDWLLDGWIHHSGFCIVTGAPGVGKTTFCLQMLHSFTTSTSFLNKEIPRKLKVLFISLEMGIIELKYIFTHHAVEFTDDQESWNLNLRILDQEASLMDYEEIISNFNPSVVLIDSISELAQQELKEEESRAITRWIKKIRRRYNTAVIGIHHNRKEGSGTNKRTTKLSDVYGSFIFGKDADTVLNLEGNDDDPEMIELTSLKARYDQKTEMKLHRNANMIFSDRREYLETDNSENQNGIGGSIGLTL